METYNELYVEAKKNAKEKVVVLDKNHVLGDSDWEDNVEKASKDDKAAAKKLKSDRNAEEKAFKKDHKELSAVKKLGSALKNAKDNNVISVYNNKKKAYKDALKTQSDMDKQLNDIGAPEDIDAYVKTGMMDGKEVAKTKLNKMKADAALRDAKNEKKQAGKELAKAAGTVAAITVGSIVGSIVVGKELDKRQRKALAKLIANYEKEFDPERLSSFTETEEDGIILYTNAQDKKILSYDTKTHTVRVYDPEYKKHTAYYASVIAVKENFATKDIKMLLAIMKKAEQDHGAEKVTESVLTDEEIDADDMYEEGVLDDLKANAKKGLDGAKSAGKKAVDWTKSTGSKGVDWVKSTGKKAVDDIDNLNQKITKEEDEKKRKKNLATAAVATTVGAILGGVAIHAGLTTKQKAALNKLVKAYEMEFEPEPVSSFDKVTSSGPDRYINSEGKTVLSYDKAAKKLTIVDAKYKKHKAYYDSVFGLKYSYGSSSIKTLIALMKKAENDYGARSVTESVLEVEDFDDID